jgi:hypothetical protein
MGALLLALIVWRADVVRLLPQTALFYKMVGLDVNLRSKEAGIRGSAKGATHSTRHRIIRLRG